ncbi:hypothetical protein J6590_069600, partial [Homalodisca vitripennis]
AAQFSYSMPNEFILNRQLIYFQEECVGALQDFSEKVNSRHPVVHSHLLLSIFKMAEVEVVMTVGVGGICSLTSEVLVNLNKGVPPPAYFDCRGSFRAGLPFFQDDFEM